MEKTIPRAATEDTTAPKPLGSSTASFYMALSLTAMVAAAWFVDPGINWILVVVLMTLFLAVLGAATNGRAAGILINEQKLMSLSRFQMVLWTVIIISGYFVIAIQRVMLGDVANPLAIEIDANVYALLGISATSLVGTTMMRSSKKNKEPSNKEKSYQAAKDSFINETDKKIDKYRAGVLYGNANIKDAQFTDIFEGDEIDNTPFIDVAKVQMFFFTVIVAIAYSAELLHLIMVTDLTGDDVALPTINEGLVALMGISNAGYLGGKSITQTPSTN